VSPGRSAVLFLARVAWLISPVFAAGVVHIAILKRNALSSFAVPIDGGWRCFGRPCLGPNKTWRGPVVMVAGTAVAMRIQHELATRSPWAARMTVLDFSLHNAWLAGGLYGLGYSLGELPNSFVKRRLGIAPGGTSPRLAGVQYLVDQLDSVVGCLVLLRTIAAPPWRETGAACLVGLLLHVALDGLMYRTGIKRIGGGRPARDGSAVG
jgi:hypothetical protein